MSEANISLSQITVEFEVKNFFSLPLKYDYYINSPPFSFSGGEYVLSLRPNGDIKNKKNIGWTCLYLRKKYSPSEDFLGYTLGIKKADGSTFAYRNDYCLLENRKAFGYPIAERSKLSERMTKVAPNGNLTIFCVLYSQCKDLDEVTKRSKPVRNFSHLNYYILQVEELEGKLAVLEKENEVNKVNDEKYAVFHTLSNNLKDLFTNGSHGDITFKTGDKDIRAHRAVLAARSSVFRTMAEMENNDGVITVTDCDAECLKSFLLFLYGGDLKVVSASNALGLYNLANKYDIPELKEACLQRWSRELIYDTMSVDTVCDVARLAKLNNESKLMDTIANFLSRIMEDVESHPEWMSFQKDNPSEANELLMAVKRM